MVRVARVEPLQGYRLRVGFSDGTQRVVDIERFMRGPLFEPLKRDRETFDAVRVDSELGTVVWPNGANIDAAVLYGLEEPSWLEHEMEPRRKP